MKGKQVSDKTTGVSAIIKDSKLGAYLDQHRVAGRRVVFIDNSGKITPYDQATLKASNG